MNKQIRSLALQAGATVDKGTHPLTGVVDGLLMRTTEIEKFAQLMVRECALVAADVVVEHEGVEFGLVAACHRHFGVE